MKQIFILPVMVLSCLTRTFAQESQPVTAEDLKAWCYYLAGDEMRGRKNGSPEMKKAADYIAASFREAGLKPFSTESGYFQEYTVKGRSNVEISERNVIGILEGSDPVLK
ncbi:MAG: hypothetical protein NTV01_04600, partial [Bacteroidia bacterium]|nr:hypothetical protein [Bacteroidia bacterium]